MADEKTEKTSKILIPAGGRFDKRVPISINGATTYIPVGIETEVSASVLEAIENAGITFNSPAGEDGAGLGVDLAPSDFDPSEEPPELGKGIGARDGVDGEQEGAAPAVEQSADSDSDSDDETQEEPGLLDKSIPDLEKGVEEISDAAEIDKLIAAEKAGKSRSGAITVLEARKAALSE